MKEHNRAPKIIIIDPTDGYIERGIRLGYYPDLVYLIRNSLLSVLSEDEAVRVGYSLSIDPLDDRKNFFIRNPYTGEYLSMYSDDLLNTLATDESLALHDIFLALGAKTCELEVTQKKLWVGGIIKQNEANFGLLPYEERLNSNGITVNVEKEKEKEKEKEDKPKKDNNNCANIYDLNKNYQKEHINKTEKPQNKANIGLKVGFAFNSKPFKTKFLIEQKGNIDFNGYISSPDPVKDLEELLSDKGFKDDKYLQPVINRLKSKGEYSGGFKYPITYFKEIEEASRILERINCKIFTDDIEPLQRLKFVKPISAYINVTFGDSIF